MNLRIHGGRIVYFFFSLPLSNLIESLHYISPFYLKAFTPFQFHVHGLLAFLLLHPPFRRLIYPFEQPGLLLVIIGDI